jgi:Chalcone isomerase-like
MQSRLMQNHVMQSRLIPRRTLLVLAAASTLVPVWATTADAPPAEVSANLAQAQLLGLGRLRFMGLRVYEARLWVPGNVEAANVKAEWVAQTLALDIRYQRALKGALIAERSLQEMRRQGDIAPEVADRWLAAMTTLFPDVAKDSRLTGLNLPGVGVRFFVNGSARGDVRDPEFARFFFGIWLSPKSSEPSMRDALLGAPSKAGG